MEIKTTRLFIEGIRTDADKQTVSTILMKMSKPVKVVETGMVWFFGVMSEDELLMFDLALRKVKMRMCFDYKRDYVEWTKHLVSEYVLSGDKHLCSLTAFIKKDLTINYNTLAVLFKKKTNFTITQYFTRVKINKAQCMIKEGKPLIEIAHFLKYSTLSHFARHFKEITGMTATQFKNNGSKFKNYLNK
jgi:YesN/AraC family two-component response regulator